MGSGSQPSASAEISTALGMGMIAQKELPVGAVGLIPGKWGCSLEEFRLRLDLEAVQNLGGSEREGARLAACIPYI